MQSVQNVGCASKSFIQLLRAIALPHTAVRVPRKLSSWQQPRGSAGVAVGVGVRGTHSPVSNSNPKVECEEHTQSAQNVGCPSKLLRQLISLT